MSIWSGTPQNLKSLIIVQHSATNDLKGIFEVGQATKDLKAIFVIGQATKELFAEAVIRHAGTGEFKALMTIRHPGTADLKALASIRHSATADLIAEFGVSRDDWIPQGITYAEYLLRVRSTIIT